jgi:hypothetical protein
MSRVVAHLNGGMGNQMFQYAAGLALAARHQAELMLDINWFEQSKGAAGVTQRAYALAAFSLSAQLVRPAGQPSLVLRALRKLRHYVSRIPGAEGEYHEKSFRYDADFFSTPLPVQLHGYFQSQRYFSGVENVLRETFATPRVMSAATRAMLARIQGKNAICVHVRRGDYVSNPTASAFHGLCGLDYYAQGLRHVLADGTDDAECFVFSDDPQWVRDNMRLPLPTTVVDINGPEAAHEDLWLMAACRHFVIANSSLSWWGAWLGSHPQKRVVAPLAWFKGAQHDISDLIPAEWVQL